MLRALLKKQLLELNTWLFFNKKTGKRRGRGDLLLLLFGYTLLMALLAAFFGFTAYSLCAPLVAVGLDWLYFTLVGGAAVLLGVFGSVFSTYASLYAARDNELLLSMPIPPRYIIGARLFGVWFWGAIYTAIAYLPALVVHQAVAGFSALSLLFGLLTFLLLSVFVLTLSALLGFVVAKISIFLKGKSFVTVLVALAGVALYYLVYFKLGELLAQALENIATVEQSIRRVPLLYWLGDAAVGGALSFLCLFLGTALLLALVLFWMDRSFLTMATVGGSATGHKHRQRENRVRGVSRALLSREMRRFTSSATYMLNSALGTILIPAVAVFVAIKRGDLLPIVSAYPQLFLAIVTLFLCAASTTNNITAPSVSLEGKTIWLMQSLPVPPWRVLVAKLSLHLLLTEPPVLISGAVLGIVLGFGAWEVLLMLLVAGVFVLLSACFGLFLNLLRPSLTWTNETAPIKQSLPVTLALFGGWGLLALLGFGYYYLAPYLSATLYLGLSLAFFALLSLALLLWLRRRGAEIFAYLS